MAESVFHVEGSTSTLLGILNQFNGASELTYETLLTTTINSKRNVLASIEPPTLPVIRYFGIGINGFYNTDDNNGRAPHQPLPTNMDLYEPIPFRCVPVDQDLTALERSKYRLRTIFEGADGSKYYCYWLKLIDYDPKKVVIIQKSPDGTEDDTFKIEDAATINSKLTPVPPKLSTGGETPLSRDRFIVRASGNCVITGAEVAEAVNIIYSGNFNKALISEMGFYTGCDIHIATVNGVDTPILDVNDKVIPVSKDSPVPSGSTGVEAVYVQLSKHRCFTGVDMRDSASTMTPLISFEAGGIIDL